MRNRNLRNVYHWSLLLFCSGHKSNFKFSDLADLYTATNLSNFSSYFYNLVYIYLLLIYYHILFNRATNAIYSIGF